MSNSSTSSPCPSPILSGSSTPSSDASSFLPSSSTPETFVLIDSGSLEPDALRSLFLRYSATEGFRLVIAKDTSTLSKEEDGWCPKEHDGLAYYVSSLFNPTLDWSIPYVATAKENASHLNIISTAGLRPIVAADLTPSQTLYILEKPSFVFPPLSAQHGYGPQSAGSLVRRGNIPTLDEWHNLWKAWDLITIRMIPQEMLHQKPIDLRHKYPHVDDPTHCHNHSDVPEKDEDWPTLSSILAFRDRVRQRLSRLYSDIDSGKRTLTRNLARTLVMTLEHEGFHIETLLYMLIQRAGTGTLPPPGFQVPQWTLLAQQWRHVPPPTLPLPILGPTQLTMGHDDSEADDADPALTSLEDVINRTYGWDNESPARLVQVGAFKAEWRPITNGDYLVYWKGIDGLPIPKSWVGESGDYKVRTLYGPVSMDVARDWPVLASYDELDAYARLKGGRLPTEPELRLFLDTYDVGHEGGANIAFRNWHPVPPTMGMESCEGKGSNGGVWEWTSTTFDAHDGLVPTRLFTGYSTDFFDTKHHVVLGASYVTIPRLARKTLRNFYQHNYPYPWVGARLVYDVVA